MAYFSSFPISKYAGVLCTDITLRAELLNSVQLQDSLYYPYTVNEGERPDTVAYNYYGDCSYDWIIFLANNITDPYYEWVMPQEVFDNYIAKKYGDLPTAQSTILNYTKNPVTWYFNNNDNSYLTAQDYMGLPPSRQSNYTPSIQQENLLISPNSFNFLKPGDQANWKPVYAYDSEMAANENKRFIRLIDNSYTPTLVSALQKVLNS